jgi:hypothetical protein
MENIQSAVLSAASSKPSDFKQHIYSALQAKVYDALQTHKVEVAGSLFRDNDDTQEDNSESEFQSSSEGNVDEDL